MAVHSSFPSGCRHYLPRREPSTPPRPVLFFGCVLRAPAASLAALNDQLNKLIELSQSAGSLIGFLLQVWEEMESELNAVLVDSLNLPELQRNLNLANQGWQTLVGLCNSIASIKYNQASPEKP